MHLNMTITVKKEDQFFYNVGMSSVQRSTNHMIPMHSDGIVIGTE